MHIFTKFSVILATTLVITACSNGGHENSSEIKQRKPSQGTLSPTMLRQINKLIHFVDSAESQLDQARSDIKEENRELEKIKASAKIAFLGGQMSEFRVWQQIGREKKDNIASRLHKAENTIALVRDNTESQLRMVSWSSSDEKAHYSSRVNQNLSTLAGLADEFVKLRKSVANHEKWLNADE